MNLFQDYLIDIHDTDTNSVFINLSGANKGAPLNYREALTSLIEEACETDINFTPHTLRHTMPLTFMNKVRKYPSFKNY